MLSSSAFVAASFSLKLNEHNFQLPIESDRSTSVGTYSSGKSQRGDKKLNHINIYLLLEKLKNHDTYRNFIILLNVIVVGAIQS